VLQAGFTITAVVVDADYGANAPFRAGFERLGLAYGVAIRGEAVFTSRTWAAALRDRPR
jgi:SRSO17 transposase